MNEKKNSSFIVDNWEDGRDEYLAKWEIALLTTILFVTIFGNSLVLFSIYLRRYRARKKLNRMYFFIMYLSIADLLTGLLDVLPQLAWDITFRFQGGMVLCKLVKFFQPFGPYLSSYILTATAIDRYQAICHPLSYCSFTSRKSKIMIYCAWFLALILCIPQLFVFSYQEITPGIWDCWATFHIKFGERAYVTWYSLMVFLLPFVVLVYTYVGICIGVWQSNKMSGAADDRTYVRSVSGLARNRSSFISKAMINTVKQTIAVITLYIITSIPFIGCELWVVWDPEASKSSFATVFHSSLGRGVKIRKTFSERNGGPRPIQSGMEQNPERYPNELSRNESENESNDEEYARSPILLDLDENSKQQELREMEHERDRERQRQDIVNHQETILPNVLSTADQHLQDQLSQSASDDPTVIRRQSLRRRWQDPNSLEERQQTSDNVLIIRVPEPEIIGGHPQLEILHETNIKSVQREPSQTEKGEK
ncbi:vasopressin V1a receptor-like isoform X1 [Vespula squamosa]|uniref:Vasopressin V1a receptor-like isoform X1 n=1 Tax=Vespula squamosa TaxID=30214 RepID=A0ABD2AC83_VESSQ